MVIFQSQRDLNHLLISVFSIAWVPEEFSSKVRDNAQRPRTFSVLGCCLRLLSSRSVVSDLGENPKAAQSVLGSSPNWNWGVDKTCGRPWPSLWPTLWPTGGQIKKKTQSIAANLLTLGLSHQRVSSAILAATV